MFYFVILKHLIDAEHGSWIFLSKKLQQPSALTSPWHSGHVNSFLILLLICRMLTLNELLGMKFGWHILFFASPWQIIFQTHPSSKGFNTGGSWFIKPKFDLLSYSTCNYYSKSTHNAVLRADIKSSPLPLYYFLFFACQYNLNTV